MKRQPEYSHDDPLHSLEEFCMKPARIIQYKFTYLYLFKFSHSFEWMLLYMSDNALCSQLLLPFECNLLVLGHLIVYHTDALCIVQQAW